MLQLVQTLTRSEIERAARVGCERQIDNLLNELKDAHGAPTSEGWQRHIEGTIGEQSLAKCIDRYWSGNFGDLQAADVGPYQVRSTIYSTGRLRLHPTDKDDELFVLATGIPPTITIRGWLFAREGKKQEFWSAPQKDRWAFFVPQKFLHPMSEREW